MKPILGSIEAFNKLENYYEVYILSTAPWHNPTAWHDKVVWVQNILVKRGIKN